MHMEEGELQVESASLINPLLVSLLSYGPVSKKILHGVHFFTEFTIQK